ncbi:nucleotidyltransferase domain-containing protein [Cytobacillus firmus]|nr:nucleotidyltransferase domain-containing protein [Cytobacillus firmus]
MGLYTKYKGRDSELPRLRERIMHSIEKDLIHDQNVLSVFYGGSIGENSTDTFSDIDLRIIVNDKVFEEFRLNKKERAKKWEMYYSSKIIPAHHILLHTILILLK